MDAVFKITSESVLPVLQSPASWENNMGSYTPADSDSGSQGDSVAKPSTPSEFGRKYRSRIFRENTGRFYEVLDTLELPFEAPDFPRGELHFEVVRCDRKGLLDAVVSNRKTLGAIVDHWSYEVIEAPAEIERCRLYRVPIPSPLFEPVQYYEVWDTVAEPCEYRHPLPNGELLLAVQDFSKFTVWKMIDNRKKELGIRSAATWMLTGRGV
jgi:hypothetical protein